MQNRPLEILLIEDNQADVELTRNAMNARKMLVNLHVTQTGEEALQFLFRTEPFTRALRPDLILLDLNLPGMDGREVLERIKTDRDLRQIPVVVLTSAHADLDILKSYSMGASCYIFKPVDPAQFSKVIEKIQDFWCSIVQLPNYELVEKYRSSPGSQVAPSQKKRKPEEPIHVLYVEDSDADFEIVSQSLKILSEPHFIFHREIRLTDTFTYLEKNKADVVLLDLTLPDSEGFETVLRFCANSPFLPLVVLTGADDRAQGVRAVKEGADDYLVKNQVQSELLGRTLLHAIERKSNSLGQLEILARERAARSEAEKAAEIRDEFLSIASHELRNPLTSLKMQMQLLIKTLRRGETDPIINELVQNLAEKADGQIDRFGKLITSLLNFSHIQSGRLKLEYSQFDFTLIVRDTVERFAPELQEAGCEIILNLGPPVVGEWDLLRIEQVLINLLSNGIKYAAGKPISLAVSSDPERVWIRITDQGPGIAPQDMERIFQRFERAPGSRKVPGFGLGLYVVRQIIDTLGGTILVKSELGLGSTFTVCLPRKAAENRRI
jgi:signal transduction histidine kinase